MFVTNNLSYLMFFSKFFTKNTTKTMILNRAKTELENLNAEGRVLENSKQALIKRRAKLFDDFTKECIHKC